MMKKKMKIAFLPVLALLTVSGIVLASASAEEDYIVLLRQPSVVESVLARSRPPLSPGARRALLESRQAENQRRFLDSTQLRVIERLREAAGRLSPDREKPVIEVVDRRVFLLNMLHVKANARGREILSEHEDVLEVFSNATRYPLLDSAPDLINAPALWEQLGGIEQAGAGVKIAIIDSGIDPEHPMFSGSGLTLPEGFPLGDTDFTNQKIIAARSYHEDFPNPQDNKTPEDEEGHGSRVASIAAGRRVQSPLGPVSGIAPRAYLGNYKVFGAPGLNGITTSTAIIKAINDAVQDGMDVINLSLGGPARRPETDPEQQAIALAVKVGVVVVIAAGNSGSEPGTITSPGTSPEAITVGAVTHGRIFSPGVEISSTPPPPADLRGIPYLGGCVSSGAACEDISIPQPVGPAPLTSIASLDATELACSPLPASSLSQKVALVKRGTCLFQAKAANVFAAGARAMIVYNDVSGGAIVMSFTEEPSGPAVMIDKNSGEALKQFLAQQSNVQAKLLADSDLRSFRVGGNELTSFSSRGPDIASQIKPDLVTIGSGLYTGSNRPDTFLQNASGTSFSSPIVSGAAALLRQLHPDWSSAEIKSALVTSAQKNVQWLGRAAQVNEAGNGSLDLAAALNVTGAVNPVSISFGIVNDLTMSGKELRRRISLKNLSSVTRTFQIHYEANETAPWMDILVENPTIVLGASQETSFDVVARYGQELRGGTFEGRVVVGDAGGGSSFTLPLWGAVTVPDSSVILEISKSSSEAFPGLAEALAEARPGNVIEFQDSGVYALQETIEFNAGGLPLHDLTIRARQGVRPTLDGTGAADPTRAVLTVENLQNVTIQGLEIRGLAKGIVYSNSTGKIMDNIVETGPDSSNAHAIQLQNSDVHIYGNEVSQSSSSSVTVFNGEALIQQNRIGTGNSPSGGSGNGIYASLSRNLAIFDNSISNSGSSEQGQGIRLSSSSALIKGNHISQNQGELGDGILIRSKLSELTAWDNIILDCERAGISLFDGAQAHLGRNTIRDCSTAGLLVNDDATLSGQALTLLGNLNGVLSTGSTLDLSNSLIAFSGSFGVRDEDGEINVANSTIFGNGGTGISLSPSSAAQVRNSILFGNGGDSAGLGSTQISHSLVGDMSFSGGSTNLSQDPLFAAPMAEDFRLTTGSPAIDRGSDEWVDSDTDQAGHQRLVDGDGDGQARVDMGALEYESEKAPSLLLPVFTTDRSQFVGLAVTNAHAEPGTLAPVQEAKVSEVLLSARSAAGVPYSNQSLFVRSTAQRSTLLREVFPQLQEGWIEILPDGPSTASFALQGDFALRRLDGIRLSPATSGDLILPVVRNSGDEATTLFVINPNPAALAVTLTWVRSGQEDVVRTVQLGGRASSRFRFRDVFGTGAGGYLRIQSGSLPVAVSAILEEPESISTLAAQPVEAARDDLFGAQLASTDGIETLISLVNTGPADEIFFEAVTEEGVVISSSSVSLESSEQLEIEAHDLFELPPFFVGWLRIQSAQASLIGSVQFKGDTFSAALPLQGEGAREFVFSHVAQNESIFTGVTLLNSGPRLALVSIEVFDPNGIRTGLRLTALEPNSKRALLLNEWVPEVTDQVNGFIRIRANRPIIGFELFGSSQYLAAVPEQVIVR